MGSSPAQHVHVQPVRFGEKQVRLRRDQGEALQEANSEGAVLHDGGYGQGGGLDIVPALDDLEVRGDGAEVLVGRLVGQIAEAEGLGDLAGGEELLKLRRG